MVLFDKDEYNLLKENFVREYRRVEPYKKTTAAGTSKEPRRQLTKNLNLRVEYKESLVETYNALTTYLHSVYVDANTEPTKEFVKQRIIENRNKLTESFTCLNLQYKFDKNGFATIDITKVIESPIDNVSDSESDPESEHSQTSQKSDNPDPIDNTKNGVGNAATVSTSNQTENIAEMAQTKKDFMQIANGYINYKYSGDPVGLDSFIDCIELLDSLTEPVNKDVMLKFIKSKLEGKAREAIVTTPTKADDIITQLRDAIKTDSAKVIEGKILALRAEKTNLTKFAERAEELAEKYRLSLVHEGFSKDKAKEMSIDKTVELCRKQSRSETLKSIIASTKFSEPKEVVAKMIVEISNLKQERQSSQFSQKNGNQNKFGKNSFSHNRSQRQNGQNYGNNSNQNRNNNKSGYQNKSNYNNKNNYSNGQSRTYTNNNFRHSNEQPVRMISGNSASPGNSGEMTDHN